MEASFGCLFHIHNITPVGILPLIFFSSKFRIWAVCAGGWGCFRMNDITKTHRNRCWDSVPHELSFVPSTGMAPGQVIGREFLRGVGGDAGFLLTVQEGLGWNLLVSTSRNGLGVPVLKPARSKLSIPSPLSKYMRRWNSFFPCTAPTLPLPLPPEGPGIFLAGKINVP